MLAKFFIKYYIPARFKIKLNKNISDDSIHGYRTIESFNYLLHNMKQDLHPVVEGNAYFPHNESLGVCFHKKYKKQPEDVVLSGTLCTTFLLQHSTTRTLIILNILIRTEPNNLLHLYFKTYLTMV